MRRMVVAGVVLACAAFIARGAVQGQRQVGLEAAPTRTVTPVEVTNFPVVQGVSGSVNVGNLPAVQNVVGGVQVTNLPVDPEGRVLVAVQRIASNALVLRSTSAKYQGDLGGRTGATQKCQLEFPGSHFPHINELSNAITLARGIVWLTSDTDWSWLDDYDNTRSCQDWLATTKSDGSRLDGNLLREKGTGLGNPGPCDQAHSILCAD